MKIILFLNKNFLYRFQLEIIEAIRDAFKDATIYLLISSQNTKYEEFIKETFLKEVDRRFMNFIKNPIATIDLISFSVKYPDIHILQEIKPEISVDWGIYLHSDPEIINSNIQINKALFKINCAEKYWFQCAIDRQKLTDIEMSRFNFDSKIWNSSSSMSFSTQNGIFNNRSKALYYFSILIVKTLSGFLAGNTKNEDPPQILIKRNNQFHLYYYYLYLFLVIVIRKIQSKKRNWKIAILQNNQLHFINQPKGSFWADPFPILQDKLLIFFESFNFKTNLGEIALLELDDQLNVTHKTTVIKRPFHLSFPNVFKIGQVYYMMPESSDNNNLCIYKCIDFPLQWTVCSEIMSGTKLVDAVWLFYDGLYWLFANKIHTFETDNNECLYLYYSKDLFSKEWKSHPLNPIVVDATKARNAGNFFLDHGKYYRPSQNCQKSYGAAVVINEITDLSIEKYSEKVVDIILPKKTFHGVHTYNRLNNLVVLDYLKYEYI